MRPSRGRLSRIGFVVALPPFGSEAARSWCAPAPKRRVIGDVAEIPVGRQHDKFVADAKLGERRIDGSDLNSVAAAFGAQARRSRDQRQLKLPTALTH